MNAPSLVDDLDALSLRQLLGSLLTRTREADFAIARIRLAGIDLGRAELANVRRCRVLLGRLDADTFAGADTAARAPARRGSLEVLREYLASGRLEVRAAGAYAWTPDFSVLSGVRTGLLSRAHTVAVVGAHYFARPYPPGGPAFTCLIRERRAAARVRERFEDLWDRGHDVLPVAREALDALLTVQSGGEVAIPADVAVDG